MGAQGPPQVRAPLTLVGLGQDLGPGGPGVHPNSGPGWGKSGLPPRRFSLDLLLLQTRLNRTLTRYHFPM